jgi:uncharacterized protein YqgC (DUF456 family)
MWYTLKIILGVLCIVIGLAALFTPLTPGSWLIFVGIELLGLTFLLPKGVHDRWMKLKEKLKAKVKRKIKE